MHKQQYHYPGPENNAQQPSYPQSEKRPLRNNKDRTKAGFESGSLKPELFEFLKSRVKYSNDPKVKLGFRMMQLGGMRKILEPIK